MKNIIFPLLALAMLVLASCEKEIEFNGEITKPLVTVNSYLIPDSTVRVIVSKSRFFLDSKNYFERIENATMNIVVNDGYTETLKLSAGTYVGNYKPQPGDSVALLIKVPGEDEVRSSAVVPMPSNIISIDTLSRKEIERYPAEMYNDSVISWMTHYELEMGLRIKDPAQQKNFYRLSILFNEEYTNFDFSNRYYLYFNLQGVTNETSGGSLLGLIGEENQKAFHLFSDDVFDGKDVIILFKVNEYKMERKPGSEDPTPSQISYIINLQSLNRATYLYLKSKDASGDVVSDFFTEPVQIYTNISNGIGIFGAITNNTKILYMNR